jgi:hypothetical protein
MDEMFYLWRKPKEYQSGYGVDFPLLTCFVFPKTGAFALQSANATIQKAYEGH